MTGYQYQVEISSTFSQQLFNSFTSDSRSEQDAETGSERRGGPWMRKVRRKVLEAISGNTEEIELRYGKVDRVLEATEEAVTK